MNHNLIKKMTTYDQLYLSRNYKNMIKLKERMLVDILMNNKLFNDLIMHQINCCNKIIEDARPFLYRFTHTGTDEILILLKVKYILLQTDLFIMTQRLHSHKLNLSGIYIN